MQIGNILSTSLSIFMKTTLLLEALDLVSNTTILGTFYGIIFTLYCLCARSLYLQLLKPDERRQAKFTLAYISLLFACTTAFLALNARFVQLAYINHSDFPGGPLEYEDSLDSSTKPYVISGGILDLIVKVATMAIQVSHQSDFLESLDKPS